MYPNWSQNMFYQGVILPLIDYGSSIWGTTPISNLYIERLSKLQKQAARIILNAPHDTAPSEMFQGSILQYFRPSLSHHLPLKLLFDYF